MVVLWYYRCYRYYSPRLSVICPDSPMQELVRFRVQFSVCLPFHCSFLVRISLDEFMWYLPRGCLCCYWYTLFCNAVVAFQENTAVQGSNFDGNYGVASNRFENTSRNGDRYLHFVVFIIVFMFPSLTG